MMVWTFYYMCENQEVQEKVYQEIIEVIGKDEKVNHVNLESLKYMRCVFDESIRCSVLAPFAARINMNADMVVQGYTIPKETPMVLALGVVQMDDEIWPQPERFIPERFLPENASTRHPFSFQPFGFAGKRKCPGYRITYAGGAVFLATLCRKFKFQMVEGQTIERKYGFVTIPSNNIWVTVTKRD
uniref:Cytochrome P450 20A1-like n=1 Tax=Saccoglossus kowalevskii TaxID=10224 RepID=A0ABM0MPD6_SACKO|nr:PREDICTED: cytochrome P450 20A1-like [Saccoglossus kowalevskii]